jgi:hypothetical protein
MGDRDRSETSVFRTDGYRWIAAAIGFTIGICVLIVASVLVLHLASEHGGRFIGSARLGNLLAIGLFVSLIAVPSYLLAVADADSD